MNSRFFPIMSGLPGIAILVAAGIAFAPAQDAPPAPPDKAQLEEELDVLSRNLEIREARLADIADQIVKLDTGIESTIDDILRIVGPKQDSKETGTRMTRFKQEAIQALAESIEVYRRKRDELRAELDRSTKGLDPETVKSDMKRFDDRINKRVEQIIGLANTLYTHKDYQKYLRTSGDRWRDSSWRKNEDWAQDRKLSTRTGVERENLVEALEQAVQDHYARIRLLEERLRTEKDPARQELLREDIASAEQKRDLREAQLSELLEGTTDEATAKVGGKEADTMIKAIRNMAQPLERDMDALFYHYAQLNAERASIESIRKAIEEREKALAGSE